MKTAYLLLILAASIWIALVLQYLLPPLSGFRDARVLLIPVLFTYGALVLPFPMMLVLAIFTGLLTDLSTLQIMNGKVEIELGSSIFVYAILGTAIQGVRKAFFGGAWWLHPPLSALCTFLLLTLQYIMICFRRDSLVLNETIAWKVLVPTVIAFLVSPLVEVLFIFIERGISRSISR